MSHWRGIVLRHTRNFKGLDGKFVRISIKQEDENDLLLNCLTEYKNEC